MTPAIRRIAAFLAEAWRAGREPELDPPTAAAPVSESLDICSCTYTGSVCYACLSRDMSIPDVLSMARAIAQREGERELAGALQAVLLLHLTGGSLAPVTALVAPPQRSSEAVN